MDPYNNPPKDDTNVVEFKSPTKKFEHVDSSTIVERLEMTDELKQLFEENGFDFDDDPPPEAA